MKLLFLIGNTAVGKMTVGQELMKITDLRLFHNHMTIELVIEIFGKYDGKIIGKMRHLIFEEFAKSDNYGLIFTYMWAFDHQADWDYIDKLSEIFRQVGAEIYYVELVASQDVRLLRNITENRLKNKPSKRNTEKSNQRLIDDDLKYRCVSNDGEITFDNYMKIDNTNLSADIVAKIIKEKFLL